MNKATTKTAFIAAISFLITIIIVLGVYFSLQDPKEPSSKTGIQKLDKEADLGNIYIKDLYEGNIQIPSYDIAVNKYDANKFSSDEQGVMKYENSKLGVVVNGNTSGEIDWAKVKSSGINFVMLRVGLRDYITGDIYIDQNFQSNLDAAVAAGLDIGVYFYSHAVTEDEVISEANVVLEQIKNTQVKYPVCIKWAHGKDVDMSQLRTANTSPEEISKMAELFCKTIKGQGYEAGFYTEKTYGYEVFDLTAFTDYNMWYSEYRAVPSFYYNFQIWEYTSQATVPGIEGNVKMCIALESYG